ncbi:dihydrofolate reductase family protein [Devosia sp. 1635]|uniref:dihydrofolate reductase family protein n=1 Tax=Devosia sp. 1635 TaxID=2726066 RepID=UPI001566431A|nr:dihydrofolate reductase family protein [Devosia sp. 1635]
MAVRVDLMISLDGFATTTDTTPEKPFGEDWGRLTASYVATRTFRERVFHDNSGAGTTGVDDAYARAYFENTGAEIMGAEIMGAGKFGLHNFPDDPNWKGWWGDEPPFHCPVFVLTHTSRPTLTVSDTTFHFIDTSIEDALARATAAAAGKDVRIGGGPTLVRAYLEADLVDYLHVAIAPIVLGSGVRLWDNQRRLEARLPSVTSETAESGTIHLTFAR